MNLLTYLPRPANPGRSMFKLLGVLAAVLLSTCAPLLAGGWTVHSATGAGPSQRSAPAVSALGENVFLFGGVFDSLTAPEHVPYNDLYRFDTKSNRWTLLQPQGAAPAPRAFAASAAHEGSRRIFVFGGGVNTDPFYSDFSVYDDTYYVCELWLCWIRYSRRYLRDISKNTSLFSRSIVSDIRANSVLDLGCGFGYTTAALKEFFPHATVTGTEL